MSHLLDNLHEFQLDAGKETKWTEESLASRRNYVQMQVEFLEHRDLEERMKAARRLTYLLQGVFIVVSDLHKLMSSVQRQFRRMRWAGLPAALDYRECRTRSDGGRPVVCDRGVERCLCETRPDSARDEVCQMTSPFGTLESMLIRAS
jgi:hypothetical protein